MTGGYNRREVLGALGAAFAGAGCLGGDSGDGTESPAAEYEDAEDNEYSAEFEESISGVEKSVEEIVDEYDDIVEGEEETAVLTDEGMATTSRYV